MQNKHLLDIVIHASRLSVSNADALAHLIANNKTVTRINLVDVQLDNGHAAMLADAVASSRTLCSLSLAQNLIGGDGCVALANAIARNRSLVALDISRNFVGDSRSADALCRALAVNDSLTMLALTG